MRRHTVKRPGVVDPAFEAFLHVGAEHLVLGLDTYKEGVVLGEQFVGAILVTVHVVQDLGDHKI